MKASKRSSDVSHSVDSEQLIVPVIQETVEVDRKLVDTGRGVRIEKRVTEREEELSVERFDETTQGGRHG